MPLESVRPLLSVLLRASSGKPPLNESPGWDRVPLRDLMQGELSLPVALENDARAAGLAEARVGAGRSASSMLYVTVGTGISAALCLSMDGDPRCIGDRWRDRPYGDEPLRPPVRLRKLRLPGAIFSRSGDRAPGRGAHQRWCSERFEWDSSRASYRGARGRSARAGDAVGLAHTRTGNVAGRRHCLGGEPFQPCDCGCGRRAWHRLAIC